jgi:DegV family protein with EDD domain
VQVLLAAKLAAEGKSKEEIIARLNELNAHVRTVFVFQNLHYLYLSGRIGRAKKLMASAFGMNPVLYVDGGIMEGLGVLKKGNLLAQLKQYATKAVQNAETNDIFLWHTRNKALTDELHQVMMDANENGKTIHYQEASPLPAVFGGPNGLSISYIGDWDKNWIFG